MFEEITGQGDKQDPTSVDQNPPLEESLPRYMEEPSSAHSPVRNEPKISEISDSLESIKQRNTYKKIPNLELLGQADLVEVLSSEQFTARQQALRSAEKDRPSISSLEQGVRKTISAIAHNLESTTELTNLHRGRLHRLFSNRETLDAEAQEIERLNSAARELKRQQLDAERKIAHLKETAPIIEAEKKALSQFYLSADGAYIRLTATGEETRKDLATRLAELKTIERDLPQKRRELESTSNDLVRTRERVESAQQGGSLVFDSDRRKIAELTAKEEQLKSIVSGLDERFVALSAFSFEQLIQSATARKGAAKPITEGGIVDLSAANLESQRVDDKFDAAAEVEEEIHELSNEEFDDTKFEEQLELGDFEAAIQHLVDENSLDDDEVDYRAFKIIDRALEMHSPENALAVFKKFSLSSDTLRDKVPDVATQFIESGKAEKIKDLLDETYEDLDEELCSVLEPIQNSLIGIASFTFANEILEEYDEWLDNDDGYALCAALAREATQAGDLDIAAKILKDRSFDSSDLPELLQNLGRELITANTKEGLNGILDSNLSDLEDGDANSVVGFLVQECININDLEWGSEILSAHDEVLDEETESELAVTLARSAMEAGKLDLAKKTIADNYIETTTLASIVVDLAKRNIDLGQDDEAKDLISSNSDDMDDEFSSAIEQIIQYCNDCGKSGLSRDLLKDYSDSLDSDDSSSVINSARAALQSGDLLTAKDIVESSSLEDSELEEFLPKLVEALCLAGETTDLVSFVSNESEYMDDDSTTLIEGCIDAMFRSNQPELAKELYDDTTFDDQDDQDRITEKVIRGLNESGLEEDAREIFDNYGENLDEDELFPGSI